MGTCCAFLVAYPFRKPFWTNAWFTVTIILIFFVNASFIVFNYDFFMNKFFDVLPYTGDYSYKINVTVGIVLNTVLTFLIEKIIAVPFTAWYDNRVDKKEAADYARLMIELRNENEGRKDSLVHTSQASNNNTQS